MQAIATTPRPSKRSDAISLAVVAGHLTFVLAPIYLAAAVEPSAVLVGLWLWFGVSSHGLINLMHEAAHRLVFRRRKASDVLGRWVLGPLFIADFDAYRERHWIHHYKFGEDEDTKDTYLVNISRWGLLRLGLSCLALIEATRRFLIQMRSDPDHDIQARASRSAVIRVATAQFVFVATLVLVGTATSSWDLADGLVKSALAYLGVYAYGLGSLTAFVAALRAIAEHQRGGVGGVDVGRAALRNLKCNLLTRLIFGAYGFAEHATHHQWPGLPSYRLEQATRVLAANDPRLAPHQGYMGVLFALWRQRGAAYQ